MKYDNEERITLNVVVKISWEGLFANRRRAITNAIHDVQRVSTGGSSYANKVVKVSLQKSRIYE